MALFGGHSSDVDGAGYGPGGLLDASRVGAFHEGMPVSGSVALLALPCMFLP